MNIAIRPDWFASWPWRRGMKRAAAPTRAAARRQPVAPVTPRWQGAAGVLRGLLIMAVGLVLAGLLGWLWATVSDPRTLPLKAVQVEGAFQHIDAKQVRDSAMPYLTGNFFTVNVTEVQKAVEALPWVRAAQVRRVWPAALHIVVTEQVAISSWGDSALLNAAGEVFTPPRASYPAPLPALQGPQGAGPQMATAYRDMGNILAPLHVRITRLSLDERRAWQLELDNGMQVVLGRGEPYGRLRRFVRFYHRALHGQEAAVERVDLRYSNGFAVRWKRTDKGN